jgi:threonine/homoserine/homoserine lactone efflux protein
VPSGSALLAFAVACVLILLVPGPSVLFTVGRAISAGRRVALLTVCGNALGVFTQTVAIAVGLGPVIAASATAYTVLKVAGAAYLIWLGVQAWRTRRATAAVLVAGGRVTPTMHALRDGAVVGVTNPKSFVFFAALMPQFVDPARPVAAQVLSLGVVFVVLAVLYDGTIAVIAARVRDWFASSPRRVERLGGAGGIAMVGVGASLLVTGRPAD